TGACHCAGCQRMTASAFSLSAAIPTDGFEVTKGESVKGGLHGDETRHVHFTRVSMSAARWTGGFNSNPCRSARPSPPTARIAQRPAYKAATPIDNKLIEEMQA